MSENMSNARNRTGSPFLDHLRASTKEMHLRLESTPLSQQLLDDSVTVESYTTYLAAMREVISFTEQVVFPELQDIISDIDQRRKLPLINADLSKLGYSGMMKPFQPFTEQASKGFLLGFMYVIEGSVLGGRVIIKHLGKRLGIAENNGGMFFTGYGSHTGVRWSSFLQLLDDYASANGEDEVVAGAQAAFTSIYDYLEKIPV